jgi:hypothetical protein
MIKIKIDRGKKKTMTVKPADLITGTLIDIVCEKAGKEISQESIVSFDGKKVEYMDGEQIELSIPEKELIDLSITQWAQRKLKTRGKLVISIAKSGN